MRIVTVSRKPFLGSVTQNVLDHEAGVLNIDLCRLTYQSKADRRDETRGVHVGGAYEHPGGSAFKKAVNRVAPAHGLGRWPANLILQHRSSCTQTGTTTTAGYTINRWSDGAKPFGGGAGHEYEGEKQGDEIVPVWECADRCPVWALGEQSGVAGSGSGVVRKAQAGSQPFRTDRGWNQHSMTREGQTAPEGYGDGGTAARFFKQVQVQTMNEIPQELIDYLATMISPPEECEPMLIVTDNLDDVDWSGYEDTSVHGMITVGNPEKHMKEIDRVLKPGAHLLVISPEDEPTGATAACAIEDFGYEIRDAIAILDTPGEFHYIAKANRRERNAGVPESIAEITFERHFPVEGTDQDALWEQIVEVVDEQYLENWLLEGIPKKELPDTLLPFFEERVLVDVQTFRNNHPTIKPVKLMEALMEDLPEGSTVVDPFMGSGSTGIAALNQNMGFIGIEQDEGYVQIAHHRIHHADRSNAGWKAANIESDVKEEKPETKSLTDFFGIS